MSSLAPQSSKSLPFVAIGSLARQAPSDLLSGSCAGLYSSRHFLVCDPEALCLYFSRKAQSLSLSNSARGVLLRASDLLSRPNEIPLAARRMIYRQARGLLLPIAEEQAAAGAQTGASARVGTLSLLPGAFSLGLAYEHFSQSETIIKDAAAKVLERMKHLCADVREAGEREEAATLLEPAPLPECASNAAYCAPVQAPEIDIDSESFFPGKNSFRAFGALLERQALRSALKNPEAALSKRFGADESLVEVPVPSRRARL